MKPILIGIAGGSAGGKSALARLLANHLGDSALVLSHDDYYFPHDDLSPEERSQLNYDEPAAYETDLLVQHLCLLKQGETVSVPVYDYKTYNRSKELRTVSPRSVIILEGILVLALEELRNQLDFKVFVDVDADVRCGRRIKRDVRKRGKTVEDALQQYLTIGKPMHERYVEPSKKYADIIVPGGGKNPSTLPILSAYIEKLLEARR